ncbi:MAG: peptide chain release factor N(5)-glutamine methyltransferase [Hydrotalea sp.]|nr:peptide chain release factor N(5)-glutamine methyltransferase [Hydrotalea sp.]
MLKLKNLTDWLARAQRINTQRAKQGARVTTQQMIAQAGEWLQERNIENPRREATLILAHLLQADYLTVLSQGKGWLTKKMRRQFWRLIKKRGRGLPFAYITGGKEFFSLSFFVNRHVLIPRPTSEGICQSVIDHFDNRAPLTICDLGTGSGCLLITLLHHFKNAQGYGIDVSRHALRVAKKNAKSIGVQRRIKLLHKNIKNNILLNKKFDVVVANPPYVTPREYTGLARNIFFEPKIALVAAGHVKKNDGLVFYPAIKKFADSHLRPGGLLLLECAPQQKKAVANIFSPTDEKKHYKVIIIT